MVILWTGEVVPLEAEAPPPHERPHHHRHHHKHSLLERIKWFFGMKSHSRGHGPCKGRGRRPHHQRPDHDSDEHHHSRVEGGKEEAESVALWSTREGSIPAVLGSAELAHKMRVFHHKEQHHHRSTLCSIKKFFRKSAAATKEFIQTSPLAFVLLSKTVLIFLSIGIITAFRNRSANVGAIRLEEQEEEKVMVDEKAPIEIVVV